MKNKEIIILSQALQNVGNLTGIKFVYAVSKNVSILKPEVEAISKTLEESKEFKEYNKKRIEANEKYAVKENGNPKIVNNQYAISDQTAFDTEMKMLKETHKTDIEARAKQIEDYNEFLDKESAEVKLHMIDLKDVPEAITAAQMVGISPIIKDEPLS